MPELREGIGCGQNKHHIYTVFDHNVRALNYTAEKNYSFIVRLASLLHDVGKPRTKGMTVLIPLFTTMKWSARGWR